MAERRLQTVRFLLLIDQLAEEPEVGSRKAAAKMLGCHPSYIVKLKNQPWREVGVEIMDRARAAVGGLRSDFFEDASLVDPDYHDFIGDERRVERDDELGYPAVEAYIAKMAAAGSPVAEAHQLELRSVRASRGPESITEEVVRGMHRGMIARDANRAIEAPLVETEIETERGQTMLQPLKKARR